VDTNNFTALRILAIALIICLVSRTSFCQEMPRLSPPERKTNKALVISIDSAANLCWGAEKISWDSLQTRLKPTYDTTSEFSKVVIQPDGAVPFREVYKVMRLAKMRGYQTVVSMKENGGN